MNSTPPEIPAAPATVVAPPLAMVAAESNVPLALGAGIAASLAGAAVWATVTVLTDYQIGWMAVGVGFLVGFAVGRFNPQRLPLLGFAAAALALFGCLLGNAFSLIGYVSAERHESFLHVLAAVDLAKLPAAMVSTFSPMDLLFYGIAIYEGYKFSMKGRG